MTSGTTIERAISAERFDRWEGRTVLLVLHGHGADEQDLLPLAAGLEDHLAVALRGPVDLGAGASWAEGDRERILRGGGLDAAADAVLAWLDDAEQRLGAPAAVRLLGFSQGGAVALTMARRAPGRFARIVLLSGFVPDGPEAGDVALAADPPAVLWGRGDADAVIPAEAIARTDAWLATHARTTRYVEAGLGHGVSPAELEEVAAFLR